MSSKVKTGETTYYSHDELNMLNEVILSPQRSIIYNYDLENRLKTRKDTASGKTDVYYYDGRDIVMEKDGVNGGVNSYYIRGANGEMLKEIRRYKNNTESFNTKYYYYPDRMGNVYMVCDEKGMMLEKSNDDAFGIRKAGTGISKFGLSSNIYDSDTGLYYFAARWYNPKVGRFLEMDPIINEQNLFNVYEYCANNPINFTDRHGEDRDSDWAEEHSVNMFADPNNDNYGDPDCTGKNQSAVISEGEDTIKEIILQYSMDDDPSVSEDTNETGDGNIYVNSTVSEVNSNYFDLVRTGIEVATRAEFNPGDPSNYITLFDGNANVIDKVVSFTPAIGVGCLNAGAILEGTYIGAALATTGSMAVLGFVGYESYNITTLIMQTLNKKR